MGCDIHGFVEIIKYPKSSPDYWSAAIEIDSIVGRNYGMFGLLFNQRNYDNFKPLQSYPLGLPTYKYKDESKTFQESERWGPDAHSHTWISYKDLMKINWEQSNTNKYICYYETTPDGLLKYQGGFMASYELTQEEHEQIRKGKEITKYSKNRDKEFVYKLGTSKALDSFSDDWKCLFDMMKTLAKQVGEDNVRLVVWFDN